MKLCTMLLPTGGAEDVSEAVEVPAGWELISVTGSISNGMVAVLQEMEPTPNMAQLLDAAMQAPPGMAVGIPSELLREALRELGFDVPEPGPIQPADLADVAKLEQRKRPIRDAPQA